ncbi:MAG: PAS domain S-box protein [Desulfomonilaceae bacterium]
MMRGKEDLKGKIPELRLRAEQLLAAKSWDISEASALSPEEVQRLVHELRVNQIELEIQNEELRLAQVKLEDLKDDYLDLYDFAPVGYVTLNDKGLVLDANLTAARLLGVERQSLIKVFFSRFVCQEFGDAYYLYLQRIFETQSKQTCEIKLAREEGTHFYAQLETVAVQAETGEFNLCRTMVSDLTERKLAEEEIRKLNEGLEKRIKERNAQLTMVNENLLSEITERKQTEEALRESEERYRAIFDNAGVGIDMVDREGRFTEVNESLAKMLGYSPSELKRFTAFDITHPEDVEVSREKLEALIRGDIEAYRIEKRFIKKDGTELWTDLSSSAVRDSSGKSMATIGVISDITERKRAEEAVRESEDRYRSLFENMLEGLAYCKMVFEEGKPTDFIYLDVNDAFERLTGLKNVVGRKVTEVIPGIRESNPDLLEIYGNVALTGNPEKFETYVDPLGIWFSISVYGTRGEYFVAVFDNITEHKRAEAALRESEQRLELAVQGADLGLWDLDVKSGRVVVNKRAAQMVGYESHELDPTLSLFERLCHPDDNERVLGAVSAHVNRQSPSFDEEYRILTKSGEWKWIQARGKVVKRDEHGNAVRMAGTLLDITQRKKSELARLRLTTAVEQAEEAITITDLVGTIQYVNPAFEKMTGYSKDEALGKNPRILKSGKQDQEFYRNLWSTVTQGKVWRGRFVNRRKDGTFYREDATIHRSEIPQEAL